MGDTRYRTDWLGTARSGVLTMPWLLTSNKTQVA